jgi:NitT/TauT family transport system substrate-binding protein
MTAAICRFLASIIFLSAVSAGAATAPVRVNIGVASVSSSALSLWVAREQGIFTKHGVDAELILIRGGSTLVASLLTNEIHSAFTSGVSVLGAAAQGVDVRMLTSISTRVSWKLVAGPQIRKPEELRGKRFGYAPSSATPGWPPLALEQLGLEPSATTLRFSPSVIPWSMRRRWKPAVSTRRCSIRRSAGGS